MTYHLFTIICDLFAVSFVFILVARILALRRDKAELEAELDSTHWALKRADENHTKSLRREAELSDTCDALKMRLRKWMHRFSLALIEINHQKENVRIVRVLGETYRASAHQCAEGWKRELRRCEKIIGQAREWKRKFVRLHAFTREMAGVLNRVSEENILLRAELEAAKTKGVAPPKARKRKQLVRHYRDLRPGEKILKTDEYLAAGEWHSRQDGSVVGETYMPTTGKNGVHLRTRRLVTK